jgi:ubiquinone/menaquinone biosynthesis C-methylase UbiE
VTSDQNATAAAYDAVASLYDDLARSQLDHQPMDRSILTAFAESVLAGTGGPVAELGCGPGHITAHLRDLGLTPFGVDLSPGLLALARENYPDLRFELGSMATLDVADGELAGIVCWYSIIHTPPSLIPAYLTEFRRVLAPGGHLLLGFFESGNDPLMPFDHKVIEAYQWPIDDLAALAYDAGFAEVGRMLRAPHADERALRRGHLLLRTG